MMMMMMMMKEVTCQNITWMMRYWKIYHIKVINSIVGQTPFATNSHKSKYQNSMV